MLARVYRNVVVFCQQKLKYSGQDGRVAKAQHSNLSILGRITDYAVLSRSWVQIPVLSFFFVFCFLLVVQWVC